MTFNEQRPQMCFRAGKKNGKGLKHYVMATLCHIPLFEIMPRN